MNTFLEPKEAKMLYERGLSLGYLATLENILEQLEKAEYRSTGFPMVMLTFCQTRKKWIACFRNSKDGIEAGVDDTPLKASFKLLINYLDWRDANGDTR